jgi:hypothetical protein
VIFFFSFFFYSLSGKLGPRFKVPCSNKFLFDIAVSFVPEPKSIVAYGPLETILCFPESKFPRESDRLRV